MIDHASRTAATLLLLGFLLAASTPALGARGDCGIPSTDGAAPLATDALTIVKEAVGLPSDCDVEPCVCDVIEPAGILAGDGLQVLRKAVGLDAPLACDCASTSTTSSTIPLGVTCRIVFRVNDDVTMGTLQWDIDYGDASGEFLGQGQNVECATLVTGTQGGSVFNDKDDQEILSSGMIKLPPGFTGPLDVAECTFVSTVPPTAEDFVVTTVSAATPGDNEVPPIEIEPLPDVVIKTIECDFPGSDL